MSMKTSKKEAMNKEIFRVDFDHAMHAVLTLSPTHSLTYSLTYSPTYSLTHR
jgi:hypothetical protein